MTLRLRLVLALLALVAVGLGVFGFVTYGLYARSQYERVDERLRASAPVVNAQLVQAAGLGGPSAVSGGGIGGIPPGTRTPGAPPQAPIVLAPDTYAELRSLTGAVVSSVSLSGSTAQPTLPDPVPTARTGLFFTTGSDDGSGDWRVFSQPAERPDTHTLVVAVPLGDVQASLDRLVLIEVATASALLAALGIGAWLILRHGLRPLETMATSARSITERSITAGALSERVAPAEDRTEVGQLGLALNTMLDEIEGAFREREATEQRLRQFLSDASHELRTPLTSIQGFAELFRMETGEDLVDLDVIMRRIEEESARMKVLVEDLLLLARLDETRPTERVPVDLAVLAADACSDAVATSPDRRVTLDAPVPVVVLGDEAHLRQAVANLVSNALHHTPPGSPLEVAAALDAGRARLRVRDHGRGLDEATIEHAFDRFWRADAARVGSGAGLGLAIVAGIAAEHGGSVEAANAPDGGAVFTMSLPLGGSDPSGGRPV